MKTVEIERPTENPWETPHSTDAVLKFPQKKEMQRQER